MEREIFPKLAEEGKLYGHHVNGLWMDIGKPEEYLETNKIILDSTAKTSKLVKAKNFELKNPVAFDKHVSIAEKSVIGPYAIIGKNVQLARTCK